MERFPRDYWHVFVHPDWPRPVMIPGSGTTPCRAKDHAWQRMERWIKESQTEQAPTQGWRMERQELIPLRG